MLTSEDFEVLWALAAIVNSAFSFLWDLVMDWGLLHWVPLKLGNFGLRPTLLCLGMQKKVEEKASRGSLEARRYEEIL